MSTKDHSGAVTDVSISAREAIHSLLGNINSRNPNQSLLALTVLDHLVKNGGYPIHLQISTKEFLNELVRRFPERPPMVTGRVMGRILEVRLADMHRCVDWELTC